MLTAGHCVCIASQTSNVYCGDHGKLMYDPQKVIRVYVGINTQNVESVFGNPDKRKAAEYTIDKVIKHPNWVGTGLTHPDLALIKLSREVKFFKNSPTLGVPPIVPICLPKIDISLYSQRAYVAGWGRTRNEDCFTDNYGPERHTRCR